MPLSYELTSDDPNATDPVMQELEQIERSLTRQKNEPTIEQKLAAVQAKKRERLSKKEADLRAENEELARKLAKMRANFPKGNLIVAIDLKRGLQCGQCGCFIPSWMWEVHIRDSLHASWKDRAEQRKQNEIEDKAMAESESRLKAEYERSRDRTAWFKHGFVQTGPIPA